LRIDDSLPLVDIDPTAVSQVLLNLLANAVKYSDQERSVVVEVTVDTRRNRRGVLISVHDRGIGVCPEDREHLFEGFFRASDRRVRERSGAGLGLALVKHIVDAHQGSIHVESRLVRGSTFRVFLPETARQPEADPETDPASSAG
ncbi:MAG: ATP-binding protein, partial [Planctomycetes bacterium]|nr:ATP-binding protein [Planctomycetota bacterium]